MREIIRDALDYILVITVGLLPQRWLSAQIHKIANSNNLRLKNLLIKTLTGLYPINLKEAARENIDDYKSFNDFFTRELKPDVRTVAPDDIVSPVDGKVSETGLIKHDILYQAKGHYFSLENLIGDSALASEFVNGQYATIYLAPQDYHRIHMPMDGSLQKMIHIPGRLWSVNPPCVRKVGGVFAKNERAILEFKTAKGKMLMILIGALFVGSIETVFEGKLTPPYKDTIKTYNYDLLEFVRGTEIGRFNFGSTVILLWQKNAVSFELAQGLKLKLGQSLNPEN